MDTKDLNKIERDREEKLAQLKAEGFNYPNDFVKDQDIGAVVEQYDQLSKEELEQKQAAVSTAGRVILK